MTINPRSFASIRRAVREGLVANRGQLLRTIHNSFRTAAVGAIDLTGINIDLTPRQPLTGTTGTKKATITGRKDGAIKK